MPFPHFDIADFPHLEITHTSVRRTLTIGLGLVQVVLGLMEIVRGFQLSNSAAVCGGLRALRDGGLAILAVVRGQERSWEDVVTQIVGIAFSLVFAYGGIDGILFK